MFLNFTIKLCHISSLKKFFHWSFWKNCFYGNIPQVRLIYFTLKVTQIVFAESDKSSKSNKFPKKGYVTLFLILSLELKGNICIISVSKIYNTLMTGRKIIKVFLNKLLKHWAVKAAGIREYSS